MKFTKIQWCHGTVNPVMGCDGCELWKPVGAIVALLLALLLRLSKLPKTTLQAALDQAVGDRATSSLYLDREQVAQDLTESLGLDVEASRLVIDLLREECKCYAGLTGTFRGGHKGYADTFEAPKLFPGRMSKAANWAIPEKKDLVDKPWLKGVARLIFISDMGDALSQSVPYPYLRAEIIENVLSEAGRRHIWLWLTKRPDQMARFGEWLGHQGSRWPDNLVAMTTVTGPRFAQRANQLRRVPSKFRGLSLEPLLAPVDLDLRGIDWVIVGGGSDVLAKPFHVEWALDLKQKCADEGIPFFFKQAGKHAFLNGKPLSLSNKHGGDWTEWPKEWRVREFPAAFRDWSGQRPSLAAKGAAPEKGR